MDFEQASLGRGATELAYLRVGFPTCWCVTAVRPELLAAAESAYREQWGHTSAAGQGAPAAELADACAGWLIRGDALVEAARRGTGDHFDRLATRDWRRGTLTASERLVHRLGVVSRLDAGRDPLHGVAQLAAALRAQMMQRWPGLSPPPERRPR